MHDNVNPDDQQAPANGALGQAFMAAGIQATVALSTGMGAAGAALTATGAFAQAALPLVLAELTHRGKQIDEMAEAAVEEAGGIDALLAHAERSEVAQRVVVTAVEAATGSSFPPALSAIGRELAQALMSDDDAKLDTAQQVIDALAAIQHPHFAVMWALRAPSDVPGEDGGETWFTPELGWFELRDKVPDSYRPALDRLLATLEREGLVRSAHAVLPNNRQEPLKPDIRARTSDYFALTNFGLRTLAMLRKADASET